MTPLLLAAFAWFAEPAPLEMPEAEAFLATDPGGAMRLVEKYAPLDLWTEREAAGRWTDREGRVLLVAEIDREPPSGGDALATRVEFEASAKPLDPRSRDRRPLAKAVSLLSPVEPAEEPERPRHAVHGMREVLYWHGTNENSVVATFAPENEGRVFFVAWELAPGDDQGEAIDAFEEDFVREWDDIREKNLPSLAVRRGSARRPGRRRRGETPSERELLRSAIAGSVANYPSWRATDAAEFTIIDDLPRQSSFPASLSNELAKARAAYASAFPSPLDAGDTLAAARIFADRGEYVRALGLDGNEDMEWTAAYWSQSRRELVAYLPQDGEEELLRTIRHEAFHQYLSYACSMIQASPWINEGYAQYFEDPQSLDWRIGVDVDQAAERLPAVLGMDYARFYDPVPEIRLLNYRMAWSVAAFLENGARDVRFDPFKDLKKKYVEALLAGRDMKKATASAFGNSGNLELFVSEWKKYWKKNM